MTIIAAIIALILCIVFFRWIIGIALIIFGICLEISWLGICFGSIILGIVLLLFAPHVLLLPLAISGLGIEVIKGE
ncbi:MAG: hypothetical protein LBC08_01040 [Campylobacteraceae bacterium]|jgi:hypothetical protein|nr:hypothetical protein [Campylobacteraceae bacterium]